jgi:hypothetical protein
LGVARTTGELLFPHLRRRCGPQREKIEKIKAKIFKWCGREDSNLHGLPR